MTDLVPHILCVLAAIEQRDKNGTQSAASNAENALRAGYHPARRELRAVSCQADIGNWAAAKTHALTALSINTEPEPLRTAG